MSRTLLCGSGMISFMEDITGRIRVLAPALMMVFWMLDVRDDLDRPVLQSSWRDHHWDQYCFVIFGFDSTMLPVPSTFKK